jgi:putative DNA primase/helicase
LASRGLDLAFYPAALRHHPALDYWTEVGDKPAKIGIYPAMLAQVTSPTGEIVGLHRIYLTPEGRKAVPRPPVTGEALDAKKLLTAYEGAMRGASVRLFEPESVALAVTEGIETALAVRLGSGLPCWAAVSAWGLENVAIPENVADVHIMADNDISGTGQRAAERLAKRLHGEARRVRIHTPSTPGTDWLDVYNSKEAAA